MASRTYLREIYFNSFIIINLRREIPNLGELGIVVARKRSAKKPSSCFTRRRDLPAAPTNEALFEFKGIVPGRPRQFISILENLETCHNVEPNLPAENDPARTDESLP